MIDIVLIGGGEHACVLADAIASRPDAYRVAGYVDRAADAKVERRFDIPWLGDHGAVRSMVSEQPEWRFVIAFGEARPRGRRMMVVDEFEESGARWATIIHQRAHLGSHANVSEGAVVLAGAVVGTGAYVGRHAIVNTATVVEHDVVIGNFAQLAPGVVIGGGTVVGDHAFLALGAHVRDHVTIGTSALVGMGSVVVANVDANTEVRGVPARPIGSTRR